MWVRGVWVGGVESELSDHLWLGFSLGVRLAVAAKCSIHYFGIIFLSSFLLLPGHILFSQKGFP